jgi:hypothetical protein
MQKNIIRWSVSLDNRKTQSETYTILNIVPSPRR